MPGGTRDRQLAVDVGAGALWPQLDISSAEAERIAAAGVCALCQDTCIGETTRRLRANPSVKAM
jgi:predicted CoA-binding protein